MAYSHIFKFFKLKKKVHSPTWVKSEMKQEVTTDNTEKQTITKDYCEQLQDNKQELPRNTQLSKTDSQK